MGSRSSVPMTHLNLKVPAELKADYIAAASAKGIDLTALINQILAEARPAIRKWLRTHLAELHSEEQAVQS